MLLFMPSALAQAPCVTLTDSKCSQAVQRAQDSAFVLSLDVGSVVNTCQSTSDPTSSHSLLSAYAAGFVPSANMTAKLPAIPLMLRAWHPSIIGGIQHGKQVFALQLRFPVGLCLLHLQLYLRKCMVDFTPAPQVSAKQQRSRQDKHEAQHFAPTPYSGLTYPKR